jgi:predicted Zn-dependent protease with MMP-like domain
MVAQLDRGDFEGLVKQALNELPDEFAERLDNVAIVVEDEPNPDDLRELGMNEDTDSEELFGLYVGVPQIDRGSSYTGLPDCIYIYMGPILRACTTSKEVVNEVKDTVVHELGHHFGLSDEEMPY